MGTKILKFDQSKRSKPIQKNLNDIDLSRILKVVNYLNVKFEVEGELIYPMNVRDLQRIIESLIDYMSEKELEELFYKGFFISNSMDGVTITYIVDTFNVKI